MSHDMTKPYTEEELEGVKAVFRSMPSYIEKISVNDVPRFVKHVGWPNSSAQIQNYVDYWSNFFDGVVPLPQMIRICRNINDNTQLTRDRIEACDTDGNGFISKEEFELIFSHLTIHDSRAKSTSFEDFVKEADTNKDGRVSIDECVAWVDKILKMG